MEPLVRGEAVVPADTLSGVSALLFSPHTFIAVSDSIRRIRHVHPDDTDID